MFSFEVKNFKELGEAERRLRDFLLGSGASEDCLFSAKLVLSELVGNVLRHAKGCAFVESRVQAEELELELVVRSDSPFVPPVKTCCADVNAEGGRGLFLVDRVSVRRSNLPDGGICVRIRLK